MYKTKDRSPLNNAGQQMMAPGPRENTTEGKRNVLEFQQRIEDLMNEIKQKNNTIMQLNDNFQTISKVYKEETKQTLE